MAEITLTNGLVALVDDEDYERLAKLRWYAVRTWVRGVARYYARSTSEKSPFGTNMSNYVLRARQGTIVDHIRSADTLDNRKCNLRVSDYVKNAINKAKIPSVCGQPTSSRYKGVTAVGKGWVAQVRCRNKSFYIGTFNTEQEAARAYDKKTSELFGEFAWLNSEHFPELREVSA